jgi:hypothetical protein
MNDHDWNELLAALEFFATQIEANASRSDRPEFFNGRASAYRNLARHIELNGDLHEFVGAMHAERGVAK